MSEESRSRLHRVKAALVTASLVLFTAIGLLIVHALDATGQFTDVAGVGFVAGMMVTFGGFGLTLVTYSWYRGELNV